MIPTIEAFVLPRRGMTRAEAEANNFGSAMVGPDGKVSIPVTGWVENPVAVAYYGDVPVAVAYPSQPVDPSDSINFALDGLRGCGAPAARTVGRPGPGELVCPRCKGSGHAEPPSPMAGCGLCDATGVIDPLELLKALVGEIGDLIESSEGVYGLHLNGDPAPWGDLLPGGRYDEWLAVFAKAQEVAG